MNKVKIGANFKAIWVIKVPCFILNVGPTLSYDEEELTCIKKIWLLLKAFQYIFDVAKITYTYIKYVYQLCGTLQWIFTKFDYVLAIYDGHDSVIVCNIIAIDTQAITDCETHRSG